MAYDNRRGRSPFSGSRYVSQYVGNNNQTYNMVATNLQNRYDKNLQDMDRLTLMSNQMQLLDVDEGIKTKAIEDARRLQESIAKTGENYHLAGNIIKDQAMKFATDPVINKALKQNATLKALYADAKESKAGDAQRYKIIQEEKRYKEAGGAATPGNEIGGVNFYEEKDIANDVLDYTDKFKSNNNVKLINGKYVYADTGKQVTEREVIEGARAFLSTGEYRKQISDEARHIYASMHGNSLEAYNVKDGDEGWEEYKKIRRAVENDYIHPAVIRDSYYQQDKGTNSGTGTGSNSGNPDEVFSALYGNSTATNSDQSYEDHNEEIAKAEAIVKTYEGKKKDGTFKDLPSQDKAYLNNEYTKAIIYLNNTLVPGSKEHENLMKKYQENEGLWDDVWDNVEGGAKVAAGYISKALSRVAKTRVGAAIEGTVKGMAAGPAAMAALPVLTAEGLINGNEEQSLAYKFARHFADIGDKLIAEGKVVLDDKDDVIDYYYANRSDEKARSALTGVINQNYVKLNNWNQQLKASAVTIKDANNQDITGDVKDLNYTILGITTGMHGHGKIITAVIDQVDAEDNAQPSAGKQIYIEQLGSSSVFNEITYAMMRSMENGNPDSPNYNDKMNFLKTVVDPYHHQDALNNLLLNQTMSVSDYNVMKVQNMDGTTGYKIFTPEGNVITNDNAVQVFNSSQALEIMEQISLQDLYPKISENYSNQLEKLSEIPISTELDITDPIVGGVTATVKRVEKDGKFGYEVVIYHKSLGQLEPQNVPSIKGVENLLSKMYVLNNNYKTSYNPNYEEVSVPVESPFDYTSN